MAAVDFVAGCLGGRHSGIKEIAKNIRCYLFKHLVDGFKKKLSEKKETLNRLLSFVVCIKIDNLIRITCHSHVHS